MKLSKLGEEAVRCWLSIIEHFSFVGLDEFIIMPNLVHGIIYIKNFYVETRHGASLQAGSLSLIINQYKDAVKRWANTNNIYFSWQPKFYDRIIRTAEELFEIRNYILNNHLRWYLDKCNPKNIK